MAKNLIKCIALEAFTFYVADHGQVHGDPGSSLDEAVNPLVPEEVVERLLAEGKIAAADYDNPVAPKLAAAPAPRAPRKSQRKSTGKAKTRGKRAPKAATPAEKAPASELADTSEGESPAQDDAPPV